jgi:signal transduction histidine kinase
VAEEAGASAAEEAQRAEHATVVDELRAAEEDVRAQREALDRAREALAAERARYSELFDAAPVALVLTDGYGLCKSANGAAATLFSAARRVLVGKPLAVFVKEKHVFRRRLVELARSGVDTLEWEATIRTRELRSVRIAMRVRRLRDGDLLWVLQDVDARVAAEVELRLLASELEARVAERSDELAGERALLDAVVEQMPAGLLVADASGRLVRANARATEIRGAPPLTTELASVGEFRGHRADGTPLQPDEWPLVRALSHGEITSAELIGLERRDGSRRWIEVSSAPVRGPEGSIVAAVTVFEDVTERERVGRAEREFITNAAHELLTPLAAITSAIDVLQGGAKDDEAQRDRFLAHAEREAGRLGRLSRALLLLARAQMGLEAPRATVVPVAPLLDEVAASLTPLPGVEVRVKCPATLAFVGSHELLMQAILNVGTNAAKHTTAGAIEFRARRGGDSFVVVEVTDSGSGIAEGDAERVLERFYRVEGGATEGFGLGLAIARAAVEAGGGSLRLKSRPSGGTIVTMTVPGAELTPR